jgi:hypothetical protein
MNRIHRMVPTMGSARMHPGHSVHPVQTSRSYPKPDCEVRSLQGKAWAGRVAPE